MPNTPTCIPKSLHTVRVLVVMARLIHRNRTISHRTAVHEAAGALGYSVLDDTYGLTEYPVMHKHAKQRIVNYSEFTQSVQPWQFGDWETKRTCLWLKGLDPLVPDYATLDDARRALGLPATAKPVDRVHKAPPGPDRDKERSRFFDGIARAMALQWGQQASTDYFRQVT